MATVADFHLHGFDVSSYQPAGPNFRAGGRAFGIFKATEGTGYFDPHFGANRSAAHAQGCLAIGLYHFARSASHSAQSEASYFLSHVGAPQRGEFAVLDYEEGRGWNAAWIAAWGAQVRAAGWRTVLYTYAGMLGPVPAGFDLWVAAYSFTAPNVGWTFWQHTDGAGSIRGNDGPWDCSVFRSNDPAVLAAFGHGGAPPPPPPPPPYVDEDNMPTFQTTIIGPGEKVFVSVPPAGDHDHPGGLAGFGFVWGSLGVDNYDPPDGQTPTPVRVVVKSLHAPSTGWYGPPGTDAFGIAQVRSGRSFGWQFGAGDEGVSLENQGTHPVSFMVEARSATVS